nr:MAG TPA: hypothetical protein [Caudoviricetes sp.]
MVAVTIFIKCEHPFPLITRVIMGQYCDKFRPREYQKIGYTI